MEWLTEKIRTYNYERMCRGRSAEIFKPTKRLPDHLKLGEFTVNYICGMNPCFSGAWDLCSKIPLTYLIKRNKVFTYKEAKQWGIDLDYIGWGIVMSCDISKRYKSPCKLACLLGLKPYQHVLYSAVARRLLMRNDSDVILEKMELK